MAKCTQAEWHFPSCKSRKVTADFQGGSITSHGGVLLLRQVDRKLGLLRTVASRLQDTRQSHRIDHSLEQLLRQRVYALACGEEDLNDHQYLRKDLAFQTATDRVEDLASPSTLCRFENAMDREVMVTMNKIFVEQFIDSHQNPPEEMVLDFDATDDRVHGNQEGRFFHGYYRDYCFLPLYVFCGSQLLCAYLRPSKIDAAKHAWAILALLVKRLREQWPSVRIIFRGDSGFCRWRVLRWCEKHDVDYVVGLAKNSRLRELGSSQTEEAQKNFEQTHQKQRLFSEFRYAADTWDKPRRVIMKAEHTALGSNPRFIVTSLTEDPQIVYDERYCVRGDMENRIKEQQLDLYADRTSCHAWWANQFRLLLSSLAYILLDTIRRLGLKGTRMAQATCGTIRLKLIRIGAVVVRNTRRVRLHLSTAHPDQDLFGLLVERLE